MDFENYKHRLLIFGIVFEKIFRINESQNETQKQNMNSLNYSLSQFIKTPDISIIRTLMASSSNNSCLPSPDLQLIDLLKTYELKTLKNVNLGADLDTLTLQADAVKNEIISLGNYVAKIVQNKHSNLVNIIALKDYIRTPDGKIVYPFDYWEDCVEVYLRKHLLNKSNEQIATDYSFKSSRSASPRAKLQLVANALNEVNLLKFVVYKNDYPIKTLSGSKQPSLKNIVIKRSDKLT